MRFTPLDPAFSVEAPYPEQRPALSHTGAPATAAPITKPFRRDSPGAWPANLDVLGSSPSGGKVGVRLSTCRQGVRSETSAVETRRDGQTFPEPTLPPVGGVTRSS